MGGNSTGIRFPWSGLYIIHDCLCFSWNPQQTDYVTMNSTAPELCVQM